MMNAMFSKRIKAAMAAGKMSDDERNDMMKKFSGAAVKGAMMGAGVGKATKMGKLAGKALRGAGAMSDMEKKIKEMGKAKAR